MTDEHSPAVKRLCAAVANAPCELDTAWEAVFQALLHDDAVTVEALERCASRLEWSAVGTGRSNGRSKAKQAGLRVSGTGRKE
ncbi:hypothetical protein [Arhodomonas sp. AD133]|uniref:hypothetical protein n=1 Tax=Arhodomonas sp. AD133 TaxID=3415009 RepID=UPI003EB7B161